jgi:hypothetical protein
MTYAEFIDIIASLTIRTDAPITSFIKRAEASLRPIAKHYLSEKVVTLPIVDGIAALPADFLEIRTITGTKKYKPVAPTSATLFEGEVGYYRIADDLSFVGEADDEVQLTYFASFGDLTETDTNWLFDRFPSVYIAAVMRAFRQWESDADGVAVEQAALNEALSIVAEDDRRGRQTGPLTLGGASW